MLGLRRPAADGGELSIGSAQGEDDPPCLVCGGILKSDTISFGQALVPEVIDRALRVSEECDVLLAVGSTLSVFPAANCVPRAKAAGAEVIIVNGDETAHGPLMPTTCSSGRSARSCPPWLNPYGLISAVTRRLASSAPPITSDDADECERCHRVAAEQATPSASETTGIR